MKVSLTVYGRPEAQGSTRAFIPKGWKRPIITSTNPKLKSWRQELAGAAQKAIFDLAEQNFPIPSHIPVNAVVRLYYKPPQNHKNGNPYKPTRPDADKALRACLDGLSGIVYADDSQVAHVELFKFFGVPERVEIEVSSLCPTNEKLF